MAKQIYKNKPNEIIPLADYKEDKLKLTDRFNNITSIIIAIVTIFGFGYGTAFVVCSLNHKMDIIELNAEHEKELEEQQKRISETQKKDLTIEEVKLFIDNYNKNTNEEK